jgi:hypothetical protein
MSDMNQCFLDTTRPHQISIGLIPDEAGPECTWFYLRTDLARAHLGPTVTRPYVTDIFSRIQARFLETKHFFQGGNGKLRDSTGLRETPKDSKGLPICVESCKIEYYIFFLDMLLLGEIRHQRVIEYLHGHIDLKTAPTECSYKNRSFNPLSTLV